MRLIAIVITLFFMVVSCASAPKKERLTQAPNPIIDQYRSAEKQYGQKKYDSAIQTLNQILRTHRNTDIGDSALFLLAKTYSQTEDWEKALRVYEEIYSSGFYSPQEMQSRLLAARIYTYKINNYPKAMSLIDDSLRLTEQKEVRSEFMELKFVALLKSGSQLEAFETLVVLSENHPDLSKRDSYKVKARAFLESRLSGPELKDFADDNKQSELHSDALYRYAVHLMSEGRYTEASKYLYRVVDNEPSSYLGSQAKRLIEQMSVRSKVESRTIGVVLPLSGKYSNIGYETLWGIQLALGIKGGYNTENIKLAIIDSRGHPEYARRGVKRLVEENHAIAIIGGLLSKTAYSAAIQAQELGIPFIALAQKEGLTDIGPFVFRNALTIDAQLDSLIKTSFEDLKLKRFAILYPNDSYGVTISNLFWRKIKEHGGVVAGVQSYPPGETDFSEPIQKLVGTFYLEDRKDEYKKRLKDWYDKQAKNSRTRLKPPVGLLPPVVDFDALFIPDGPKAVGQIAPMLAYNDVRNVYLIGTNIWNSDEFLRRGQNFVNQSLFTDGFFEKDESFMTTPFYLNYTETFNKAPSSFSLLGYDSGLIVRSVMSSGVRTRVDFSTQIQQNRGIPGALSTLMLNNRKEFIRPVIPLTVKEGEIIPYTKQ